MDRESAVKLYNSFWWLKYPLSVVAIAQLNEKRLCMPFVEFQRAVEVTVHRPVWIHEFAKPRDLLHEVQENDLSLITMEEILNNLDTRT